MSVAPVSPLAATPSAGPVAPIAAAPSAGALVAAVESAMLAELMAATADPATPQAKPAIPASPTAQAVDTARAAAAIRQGSLAPLFANLAQAVASPALPAPLRAAIGQVLALQLPTSGPLTAETVQKAVAQSGVFLEAHLASPTPTPAPPDLKAALLVLQRALSVPAPDRPAQAAAAPALPAQTRAATGQTPPAPIPPANAPVTVAAIRQAVAQSGPFLEARLANPATPAAAAPPDLKAALAVLRSALASEAPAAEPQPAAQGETAPTPKPTPALPPQVRAAVIQLAALQLPAGGPFTPQTIRQAVAQASAFLDAHLSSPAPPAEEVPPDLKAALAVLQRALAAAPAGAPPAEPRALNPPPPPPHRLAAPTAQAPAPATLSAEAEPPVIAQHLRGEVAQAMARQTLHQLASLPEGSAPSWMFELPLATPQGTAVAQFVIDRDGEAAATPDHPETWRARFSIDFEPLGPVHVHLRMDGERAAVTVWAERAESLEHLRGQGAALAQALPADVTFRGGAPARPAPASGQFVDQTS